MKKLLFLLLFFLFHIASFSQSIDDVFPQKKMKKDLAIFKEIREKANSGLYKYRTKKQIDSIYNWAEHQIPKLVTFRDFYNLIFTLSDFEGSLHNNVDFPEKYYESLKEETSGYFPYPIKWIDGKWRINFKGGEIPLGAEIISINKVPISEIIKNLSKYYSTDGINTTGKRVGMRGAFSKFYRYHYGLTQNFKVEYKTNNSTVLKTISIKSIGYKERFENFKNRFSKPFDQIYYEDLAENEMYKFKKVDKNTGVLTLESFAMGGPESTGHKAYAKWLDSIFIDVKKNKLKNLIVDVRNNGGGNDPNDIITYSYLTQRNFQENTQAWISFKKIPLLKYIYTKIPRFLRPFGVRKYNKSFTKDFPKEIGGKIYQDENSNDHQIRKPNTNAFTGNVYLLIAPEVASAASLFAAMLTGNKNTVVVGEETMGGYYGHNGHNGLGYILPNSKIATFFYIVNLEQDVPKKNNQKYNRGIIPDYQVSQSYKDFLEQKDTQMNFVLDLIKE